MAFPSDAQRAKQRREEERQRQREEERRQAELERRQEEEREREREEERRQEALRQTQEFEAALEAEQERRAAFLARFRQQNRAERRSSEREQVRRDWLREILRAANRQERNEERNQAEQESARREELRRQSARERQDEQRQAEQEAERRQAARQAQRQDQREAARGSEQAEARPEAARQSRREQPPEPERDAGRTEARSDAARQRRQEEERADGRAAARAAEAREARREEAVAQAREQTRADERRETQRQERRQEQQDAQRETERETERRSSAREARQQEQREAASEAEQTEARRDTARQSRREAEQAADQAEARRQSARQARLAEQRDAARDAERSAEARAAQQEQRRQRGQQEQQGQQRQQEQRPALARDPLQARIPSGAISGSLPWLVVNGNQIVNLDCNPVRLRGVSLLGLDSAPPDPERGFAAGATITEAMIDTILGWGANVIRVAINHQRVLNGLGAWSGWDYLADLDWIIRRAAEGGAYTMLSLRRLDESTVFGTLPAANGERITNFIAPQPDYDTVGMWRLLGERYADEPAVLFDLYTSPHGALEDDLTGFDTDWDLWTLWVRLMVAETRLQHPRALCFVSGLNWATDLSGFPVIGTEGQPIPNLVYAAHFYPRRDNPLTAMRALARSHPVFVTEWGGGQAEVSWGERTALALREAGAGWTAAHWNADPPLARAADHRIAPTPFGMVVRRALALTGERAGSVTRTVPSRLAVN